MRPSRIALFAVTVAVSWSPTRAGQAPITEIVDVGRLLVDVRVLDKTGGPIAGLQADDFEVAIDGAPARVERADWYGRGAAGDGTTAFLRESGRHIVFFVQKTLDGNVARRERDLMALTRALHVSDTLVLQMTPADRAAIVSFDVHLKIWSDFTSDRNRVRDLLMSGISQRSPSEPSLSPGSSLRAAIPDATAASTSTVAESLQVIAGAMEHVPGARMVVFIGYGFGRPDALRRPLPEAAALPALLDGEYADAVRALNKARTAVFAIDVTAADRHVLQRSVEQLAADSGGVFARAHPFPDLAFSRIGKALDGHYVLSIERPPASSGSHRVAVRVPGRQVEVHAPDRYVE